MKNLISISLLFFLSLGFAQELNDPKLKYYEEFSSYHEIHQLKKELASAKNKIVKGKLLWYIGLNYNNLNKEDSALFYYLKAKEIFKNRPEENKLLLTIHQAVSSQDNYSKYGKSFLDKYYERAKQLQSDEMLCNSNVEFAKEILNGSDENSLLKAEQFYRKALDYNSRIDNPITKGNILQSLGYIEYTRGNFSLSRQFLDNAIVELTKAQSRKYLIYAYYNYANSYFLEKKYPKSIEWQEKTLSLKIPVFKKKFERLIYKRIAESYDSLHDYRNSIKYYKIYNRLNDSIKDNEQNITINEIETKYNVKEKDHTIYTQEQSIKNNKKYRIMYFILAVIAFAMALYSFIRWKKMDFKRKKLLSEKQDIETEHTQTLKELEKVKQLVIEDHIILKNKAKIYINELIYLKSEGHYLEFYTLHKKEFLRGNISEIIKELPPNFAQVHRSYIINKNYIISKNSETVFLKGGAEIPVSRSFKKNTM